MLVPLVTARLVAAVEAPAAVGMYPLAVLGVGVAVVLGMILALRLNAFFALIAAALVVSLLSPGAIDDKAVRVAEAFGATAGKIGISIAMAAVIGAAMTASGAADRIVRAFLRLLGEPRAGAAMAASGFVLSIPVFFDTVFYLLCPLARSMHRRTGRHYLKYLLALGAGGTATHTLVPPTPGPLAAGETLGVDVGMMMLVGLAVSVPATIAGMAFAAWMDRRLVLATPPELDDEHVEAPDSALPGLAISLAPIVLPIVLIAGHAVASQTALAETHRTVVGWLAFAGNPNIALMAAAAISLLTYVAQARPARQVVSLLVEESLAGAGVIILITAAGGAFGMMLKEAGVGDSVDRLFGDRDVAGYGILLLAFAIASMMKLSQGSTTVAMITASSMIAAMVGERSLGFHHAYLTSAVGCGAMVSSWMNDSGFWVFCRMGGLNEREGLKTWTPLTSLMGFTGMIATMALSTLFPLV